MTNTNSPAEPTPSNPAAGTTAAAATGKPARKGPRRATAAAGAPVVQTSPAPALLVIDANGMIVPPPVVPASESLSLDSPDSLETFDAGSARSADAAAIDVVESDSAPLDRVTAQDSLLEQESTAAADEQDKVAAPAEADEQDSAAAPAEAETATAAEAEAPAFTAEEKAKTADTQPAIEAPTEAEPTPAELNSDTAVVEAPSDTGTLSVDTTAMTTADDGAEADTGTNTTAAVAAEEKNAAEGPDKAAHAAVAEVEPTAVEASHDDDTGNKAIDDGVPDSEASVEETAPSDATLAEPDSIPEAKAPTDAEATTDTESATATATSPISRRERRLAEQQAEKGGVAVAALPTTEIAGLETKGTDNAVADGQEPPNSTKRASARKSKPRTKRNRFAALIRGLFFLLVISVVVVAMGTVLSGPDVDANQDSPTQRQRQAAWEATTTLQASALSLADAASTPVVSRELATTAAHLGLQAAALSDGLPSGGPTASETVPAVSSIAELLKGLATNADSLLSNAQTAESSMGRVFASVGTSQLLQADHLGSVTGATVPASAFLPAKVSFPIPTGPQCTSTLEPRPGATVDSALNAAALAEQKAVYAYQVATTRFAEPQFSKSKALLTRHQEKLAVLNEELRLRCLPPAAPVAGFELDSTFTKLPKQALSTLELELGAVYADLSALSTENSTGVSPTTKATAAASTAVAAAGADATQQPLNGSSLREIAVLWLLDSIQTHTFWGGTVDALPGIAEDPAAASEPVK